MNKEDISNEVSGMQPLGSLDGMDLKKKTRPYRKITDELRIRLLEMVKNEGFNLRQASKKLGINYSSAKTIMRTYKEKGRIHKKLTRDRKKRGMKRFGHEVFQKGTPPSCDRTDSTADSSLPTFNFSVYTELIQGLFMKRYDEKVRSFEDVSRRLTLPVPEKYWLCRLGHGHTTAKLKGKSVGDNLLSTALECT